MKITAAQLAQIAHCFRPQSAKVVSPALIGIACLLLFLTSSLNAAEDTPEDYYFQAISATRQRIQEPPYYAFHYKFEQRHNNDVVSDDLDVVENTAMRNAAETVHGDASKHFVVLPDLFGSAAVGSTPPSADMLQPGVSEDAGEGRAGLTTIGSVSVRYTNYAVTIAQADGTSECGPSVELRLVPKENVDEYKYNLRSLTIAKSTGSICGATAFWRAGVFLGHRFPILFDLHVDQMTGLVTRWTASGTARSTFISYRFSLQGEYTDIASADEPLSHP